MVYQVFGGICCSYINQTLALYLSGKVLDINVPETSYWFCRDSKLDAQVRLVSSAFFCFVFSGSPGLIVVPRHDLSH